MSLILLTPHFRKDLPLSQLEPSKILEVSPTPAQP